MPTDSFARTLALQGQSFNSDIASIATGKGAAMIGVAGGGTVADALAPLKGFPTVAALRSAATAIFKDGDLVTTASASSILDIKGGGTWRWDASDSASVDNTGTIVTPSGGGAGRWKRVFTGKVSAAWFGVSPLNADNTRALQNAVDYIGIGAFNPNGGGVLFIPAGYYRFRFAAGTSGLTTISVPYENVTIEGEGRATVLRTDLIGLPVGSQHAYFFTWSQTGNRGQGGGIRQLRFDGNSQLQWCVFLDAWRFWHMEDVNALDIYGGLLDACNNQTTFGENIHVNRVDYISSSGTNSCFAQYGVRFRAGTVGAWSECSIRNTLFVNCWDTGVELDGCMRFTVDQIAVGCNSTSSNTISGTNKTGALHALVITNSVVNGSTVDTGQHVCRNIYLESHTGTENVNTNQAVLIDTPPGQTGFNRYNRIENVVIDTTLGKAAVVFSNTSGVYGLTNCNTFTGNRRAYLSNQVLINTNVVDTYINLTPNSGSLYAINDLGVRTFVNGVTEYTYTTGLYPDTTPGAARMDVGHFSRDLNTGRLCYQDKDNVPVLIYGRPGIDEVSPYGAQRIRALGTPAAPIVTRGGNGSTSYTYRWVAVDKDGNKSPPGPATTIANGPASLAGSARNLVTGMPVDGAVTYDLLKGNTTTSVATGLIAPFFYDGGGATAAYTPATSNPPGTLVVDGHVTSSALAVPTIAAGPAAGTGPTVSITGNDQQGVITIVVGTSPATGILATITFGNSWDAAPKATVIGPATANAGASGAFADTADMTTALWRLRAGTALVAGTTYRFAYHVG